MAQPKFQATFASPISKLGITLHDNKLTDIDFLAKAVPTQPAKDKLASQVAEELQAYFTDPNHRFNVPLNLIGTPFQQQVWQLLASLEVAETLTYGECAHRLNTSPRAIGNACRQNPIPIIIPCHRIVSQSDLGGYSG